ncbi:MAG TPA: DUF2252 domain-containing protein [Actinomycetota bacterium]|nr:DUF2252 domain-containing protein [Actinomycetota bacterium]
MGARRSSGTKVPHLTVEQRIARGKAARAEVPRSNHAVFTPSDDRPDPLALLEEQAANRVTELVPIRYGRMLVSPFTFYRGAALIMAADLASTPTSGLRAQVCGDAHLSNFGVFGSPERRLMFDVNDFDETLPGPWEWDVKRLCASLEIAGRNNGFTDADRRTVVLAGARQYREAMAEYAGMHTLAVWYSHLDIEDEFQKVQSRVDRKRAKAVEKDFAKARARDNVQAFTKLTDEASGEPRIVSNPPLIVPIEELLPKGISREQVTEELTQLVRRYRGTLETDRRYLLEQFRFVHLARKVVGVGSVGTRAWIGLFLGRDNQDPLFLQMKEAQESVLERFVGKSAYPNHGQRVVAGQRLMQATSDIFLGWDRVSSGLDGQTRDFYIRQLRDMKGSAEVESMIPSGMEIYARICAQTLARAHARSGDRIAIASYLGKGPVFDQAIVEFSAEYAEQNERDYELLQAAVKKGTIKAETGL